MVSLVERYFDGAAHLYDEVTQTDEGWSMPGHVRKALADLNGSFASALAIGVGTGRDIEVLRDAGIGQIAVLDISRKMLDVAAQKFPGLRQIHADFLGPMVVPDRFDLALCIGVAEFVEDKGLLIQRIADVLHPGGVAILSYEPEILGYGPQASKRQLIHSREQDAIYDCDGVYVHRTAVGDIAAWADKSGLRTLAHSLCLAYRDEHDIFYGLAVLERR